MQTAAPAYSQARVRPSLVHTKPHDAALLQPAEHVSAHFKGLKSLGSRFSGHHGNKLEKRQKGKKQPDEEKQKKT